MEKKDVGNPNTFIMMFNRLNTWICSGKVTTKSIGAGNGGGTSKLASIKLQLANMIWTQ